MANPVSQFQLTDLFNMTNFNSKITDTNTYIETLVEEAKQAGVKIATGSYVGTGTYGADNPCSLTFDFEPKLLFIQNNAESTNPFSCWIVSGTYKTEQDGYTVYFTWNNNVVIWYAINNATAQLNGNGLTYLYVAIT